MRLKQLIVGWNRGGMGYAHELLSKSGCDVGLTFGPGLTLKSMLEKLPEAHQYEVSPYIIPYLGHPELRDVKVVFLLRDPMRVLNSLYFHGLFHNEKNSAVQQYACTHLPTFERKYKGRPAQAACSYINHWFKVAKKERPDMSKVRIEDGPRIVLEQFVGHRIGAVPFVTLTKNTSNCKQLVRPSDLPENSKWGMDKLLLNLGYRESIWAPRGGHAHYVNADWHC